MDFDLPKELNDSGGQRALYIALIVVIDAHHDSKQAAKTATNAIESLIVETINKPGTPEHWLAGMQDLQRLWSQIVADKYS